MITFNFVEDLFQALFVAVLTVHLSPLLLKLKMVISYVTGGMLGAALCLNVVVGCFWLNNNI